MLVSPERVHLFQFIRDAHQRRGVKCLGQIEDCPTLNQFETYEKEVLAFSEKMDFMSFYCPEGSHGVTGSRSVDKDYDAHALFSDLEAGLGLVFIEEFDLDPLYHYPGARMRLYQIGRYP